MSVLMSAMAAIWSSVAVKAEGVLELALQIVVRRKGLPGRCATLRVELDELAGHIGHGFFDAGLGLLPGGVAELVEHGRRAGIGRAVLLDEVEPRERNVELGLVCELEDHEFELFVCGFVEHAEPAILRDAVLDVHDVVPDGEVAEVGDEGGGFGFAGGGTCGDVGFVREIVGAEEDDLAGGSFF